MKRESFSGIKKLKPLLYTTIFIILFMIIIPLLSIKSEIKIDLSDYIKKKSDDITKSENKSYKSATSAELSNYINIDGDDKIKVYRTLDGRVEEVDIEEYTCGVVANEMQVSFNEEALKAQAIASRTYMVSKMDSECPIAKGADICDSTHCQVYSSKEELINKWGEENGEKYWNKIREAVDSTKGMVLTYNGELVKYPLFFSTSSGKTESAEDATWGDIPYLKSVESKGEEVAPKYTSTKEIALSELVSEITSKYPNSGVSLSNISSTMEVLSRSDAGGVIDLQIGSNVISGAEFRFLIGLNSTNFTYSIKENSIEFNCKGYGHGVGMSQWGANIMAKEGKGYEDILKHYYTGVSIGNLKFN